MMSPAYNLRGFDGPMLRLPTRFAPRGEKDLIGAPSNLPDGWFTAPDARTGELGRMWVQTGTISSGYVFGEAPRPVVGAAYRNDSVVFPSPGPAINAIRLSGSHLRLHGTGGAFNAYIGANDGGEDEPNLSLYIHTSADSSAELRFDGIVNAGGGFVNWTLDSTLEDLLETADTQLILVLADAA